METEYVCLWWGLSVCGGGRVRPVAIVRIRSGAGAEAFLGLACGKWSGSLIEEDACLLLLRNRRDCTFPRGCYLEGGEVGESVPIAGLAN